MCVLIRLSYAASEIKLKIYKDKSSTHKQRIRIDDISAGLLWLQLEDRK